MLDKSYNPAEAEARWYAQWEESGAFKPAGGPDYGADGADTFSIVIPPPNVTGSLHMGHALNNTLQDALARFERMRGKSVLWQPGMDHAGIATQMVVERKLAAEGNQDRRSMGREAFVEKVWEWKAESGGAIFRQLRRLGASCDWSRERFTLDEGLSKAVARVFVQLHKEGLIYRDKRLVNWDPQFQTAISDLEVENREVDGHYWHFAYKLADGSTYRFPIAHDEDGEPTEWEERDYIVVATTRPETMLGDTAVAVHPDDKRYQALIGKTVTLPIVGREIPIVADEYADPDKGSGAVKITPAHDFNDFQVGQRHGLPAINVFDTQGRLVSSVFDHFTFKQRAPNEKGATLADEPLFGDQGIDRVPERYRGLDRFDARKKIVAEMGTLGQLVRTETAKIMVPYGDRSGVVVEPFMTDQWYVDAKTLAGPAIEAVETGKTRFVPDNWKKTYFEWMRNIEPWCVSRQLWWGHRIPAWYDEDGNVYVAETEEEAIAAAGGKALTQDEDVLDTWFSSGLWPFSTMGWPDETPELKAFYPTSVLVTAFDIIFFWVARMMMQGIHFTGEVPFRDVYIHALVRDEKGQKMSKSKGNVIDPLDLIDEYGADALRFTLAAMAAQGRDIKLSEQRVAGYRNFGTKLWNAARFGEMNGFAHDPDFDPANLTLAANRWIAGEAAKTAAAVTAGLEEYKFNEACGALYRFTWNVYCDWWLELVKPVLGEDGDAAQQAETRATGAWVLDQILKLLHPFMPFLSEELWAATGQRDAMLIVSDWPALADVPQDAAAAADIDWLIALVTEVRSMRSELNAPPGAKAPLVLSGASDETRDRAARLAEPIARLARLSELSFADAAPKGAAQAVVGEATLALPLEGLIDVDAERERLSRDIAKMQSEIDRFEKKLGNEKFVAKAPAEVVEGERAKLAEAVETKTKLEAALGRLGAAG